jgi:tetratricopeptide (TPR) repeat protein
MASARKEADARTLLERGKAFAAIGDHTRAEEYLASAIDAGANPQEVLPILIEVCVRTGRYRSAIQHGENHLRKHPKDVQTRVILGALYAAINEAQRARAQLEQVVPRSSSGLDDDVSANARASGDAGVSPPARDLGAPSAPAPERLKAQAHYLLAVVARDSENDVVEADRHFREYLRIEPNGSHAEEAKSCLLKRMP